MSAAQESRLHLEIAHVLFLDLVGYSQLLVNEQREVVQQLNDIVRATAQFRQSSAAGKLICIATGDGMALVFFQSHAITGCDADQFAGCATLAELVFFQSPEEPVHCAMEIARA